jgi:hypothetical protein
MDVNKLFNCLLWLHEHKLGLLCHVVIAGFLLATLVLSLEEA